MADVLFFEFIHKGFVKAVYSDVPDLNLLPTDLGEGMLKVNFDNEAVKRLNTAVGTVAAGELFVTATINTQVLKTSAAGMIYFKRMEEIAIIPGTLTIYDDANKAVTFSRLSMSVEGYTANATEPFYNINVKGNMVVNSQLLTQLGG